MNNKGDILEMIIFLILITILALGFLIFSFVVPKITEGLYTAGLNETINQNGSGGSVEVPEITGAIDSLYTFGTVTIQRGFFLLFGGLIMGIIISSYLLTRIQFGFFCMLSFWG